MPFAQINGVKAHFQRLGDGRQTVVCLHGLIVDNMSSFYFTVANPLAKHARVVLYDMRGHGLSGRPETGYRLDVLVDDLRELIRTQLDDEPVYLLGNSFGGVFALTFAHRYPDLVRGAILVDPLLPLPGWREDMVDTLTREGDDAIEKIADLYKNWHARESKRKASKLARTVSALVKGTTIVDDIRQSTDLSDAELATVKRPVLAVFGESSNVLDNGRTLQRLLPDCTVTTVAGCTHLVLFEGTRALVDHAVTWLKDRP